MQSVLVLSLLLSVVYAQQNISLGNSLYRSAGVVSPLPMNTTAAINQGWLRYTGCVPGVGIAFGYGGSPNSDYPVTLYYTAAGQLAGIGTDAFGNLEQNLISKKYWNLIDITKKQFRIKVSFRAAADICTNAMQPGVLGDRLVINQDTNPVSLPVTEKDATTMKWTKGSCIQGMGTHWSYDVLSAPRMSWMDMNLLPVVTMYYRGAISAIFFNSPVRQQSILPIPSNNMWDIIPIPSFLMCKNWCDDACDWDTMFWSTMHIYFYNPDTLNCGSCTSKTCCQ